MPFLYSCYLFFLWSIEFYLICHVSPLELLEIRKNVLLLFEILFVLIYSVYQIPVQYNSACRSYATDYVLWFIDGCPSFNCLLVLLDIIVWFILNNFSKLGFKLSFSWFVSWVCLTLKSLVRRSNSLWPIYGKQRFCVFSFGDTYAQTLFNSSILRFY